ncbi:MAG TPA: PIG-L family deacetylase [Terriglobales bacterium]
MTNKAMRLGSHWLALPLAAGLGLAGIAGTWAITARAQAPRDVALRAAQHARPLEMDRGAAAVWQSLAKLRTRGSLLYFTAHPDDEDGGMLAYESRGQGARVALLTLNRGESGQNAMSPDFFDALGLVRTQEPLAADRYYGVQQYFTRVVDYGFSKTKEQAFQKWDHNRVLGDAVRVVRMTRPLVVASVFVGGHSDGHGNHMVAGELAQEVYSAAGDPKMFPEQIAAGLQPWTPLKVYARVPVGAVTAKGIFDYADGHLYPPRIFDYVHQTWIEGLPSTEVEIPEGTDAPLLGGAYDQISRQGLGEQRTQNGGPSVPQAGPSNTPYHLYGSRVSTPGTSGGKENSIFEGIDTSLAGIASLAPAADAATLRPPLTRISQLVAQATAEFSASQPDKIAPLLAQGLAATNALIAQVQSSVLPAAAKYNVNYELKIKQAQFNDALTEALGLSVGADVAPKAGRGGAGGRGGRGGIQPGFQIAIPGQQFAVQVHVANSGSTPVQLTAVSLAGPAGENWQISGASPASAALAASAATDARFAVAVPSDAAFTRPYYSRPSIEQAYYNIDHPQYLNLPNMPYPLTAWAHFSYHGVDLQLGEVVQTVKRVEGPGTVENPLLVGPAISVTLAAKAGVVPLDAQSFPLEVTIHSNVKGAAAGTARLALPEGWTSEPASAAFHMAQDGQDQPLSFEIHPRQLAQKPYTITAVADYGGQSYKEGYVVTGYEGVRPYNLYNPATYRATGVDVHVAPGLSVAYITGTGDDVPQALSELGVNVHFLSDQDLASADLSHFDAIVLGVRAYAARPALATNNGRLLAYVNNGGALIVQYNSVPFNYGPYPFDLGTVEKVMDEHSAVQLLAPSNPVLSWPNKITAADFQGWVEERGHSFMGTWDSKYTPLVEMHDPDQDPQKGGLLYAQYGKGVYVYEGLALYRQFTEGVPGAYRIFANLVSVGKAPQK